MSRHRPAPRRALAAALALILAAAAPAPAGVQSRTFESHWQDGRAELDGYRYKVVRYGQERLGQAVMIFVTEPFSETRHVKVDDPRRNPRDTFEALKLNFVRDFQTGIYDYSTLVSLFSRSSDFSAVKISFSAGEWCGHAYEETDFERHRIVDRLSSYFEGESAIRTLQRKKDGIAEDQLFILLRDLRGGALLEPGGKRTVPFLSSPFYRRLGHRHIGWGTADIERRARSEGIQVPAGRFDCDVYVVRASDGREGRFWIERAHPKRVIRWSWTPPASAQGRMARDGCDSGELAGSMRVPYWQLNAEGNETYLRELGLAPGAPRPSRVTP
jgi:hypothetical protein